MIENRPNLEQFIANMGDMSKAYQRAFAGFPWLEDLSLEEVLRRINQDLSRSGFGAILLFYQGKVGGADWFNTPNLASLATQKKGDELQEFVEAKSQELSISNLVYERELLVDPSLQGRGYGRKLRENFFNYLEEQYPQGALVVTRMRDDNVGTLKIAQGLGFQGSGITMPASQLQGINHEYWYKTVLSTINL